MTNRQTSPICYLSCFLSGLRKSRCRECQILRLAHLFLQKHGTNPPLKNGFVKPFFKIVDDSCEPLNRRSLRISGLEMMFLEKHHLSVLWTVEHLFSFSVSKLLQASKNDTFQNHSRKLQLTKNILTGLNCLEFLDKKAANYKVIKLPRQLLKLFNSRLFYCCVLKY